MKYKSKLKYRLDSHNRFRMMLSIKIKSIKCSSVKFARFSSHTSPLWLDIWRMVMTMTTKSMPSTLRKMAFIFVKFANRNTSIAGIWKTIWRKNTSITKNSKRIISTLLSSIKDSVDKWQYHLGHLANRWPIKTFSLKTSKWHSPLKLQYFLWSKKSLY